MKQIKVLVVDDSFFMRKLISDILVNSGIIEVIDTAKNGAEAIDKAKELAPDVITLDVEMPKINGLEALQKIMETAPVPVIMLSSLTKQGADTTIQALQYGAFDFVAKPSNSISFDIKNVKNELIDKILLAYKQKEKWKRQWNIDKKKIATKKEKSFEDFSYPEQANNRLLGIVAIGTSTGGPKALQEVITNIPKNFPYAILIVQHMPAGFTKSLSDRLDSLSAIKVVEAEDGMILGPGTAYIAHGNYHLTVEYENKLYKTSLNQLDPVSGHRPSVDVLFHSLTNVGLNKIFVVMTGMGSDGTQGVLKAKNNKNDFVIAEDEKTCIVYGMPKSAITSGVVDIVVPLYNISDEIVKCAQKQRGWQSSWK